MPPLCYSDLQQKHIKNATICRQSHTNTHIPTKQFTIIIPCLQDALKFLIKTITKKKKENTRNDKNKSYVHNING